MQGNFLVFAHASPRACPRRASLVVRVQFKIHSNFVQYTPPEFMYLIRTEVKDSQIDGRGVFALQDIPKGEVVWKFDAAHDRTMSTDEYNALTEDARIEIERVAYISPTSGRYVYPPEGDPARFTNHSKHNNLSAIFDAALSAEPYFIANKNITLGEELTNDYDEFDSSLKNHRPRWM